jgi:hypothetical protein
MKTAIIVYGLYRQFDIAHKSWGFLDYLDCDVYVSTWNKSKEESTKLNINIDINVTEEHYTNYFPDAVVDILNQEEHNPAENIILTHWKNGLRLIRESNKQYDQILIIRADAYVESIAYKWFPNYIEPNKVYSERGYITIKGKDDYFVNDFFFIGNYNDMSRMIDNASLEIRNIHDGLSKILLSLEIYVYPCDGTIVAPLRPTCRSVSFEELKWDLINQLNNQWIQ